MTDRIVIGTRGSKLAVLQAESVASQLRALHPGLHVMMRKIVTEGDRNRSVDLDQAGSIGIFVRALEDALIESTIDLAVHSLKDLPTALPDGLYLAAVTRREDPRDVLVAGAKLNELSAGALIGTGSLRRRVQLKRIRPDLEVRGIRGNIDTRLRKVTSGQFAGIILAAAAMHRLGLDDSITEYLPLNSFIPAIGQGAIAIEARTDDAESVRLAGSINHLPTWQEITAERAFLHTLGGGCRAPIAALARIEDAKLKVSGMVADPDGSRFLTESYTGEAINATAAGIELARIMLERGASTIINDVRCA
jgi:hydroxymethylbilane synthase